MWRALLQRTAAAPRRLPPAPAAAVIRVQSPILAAAVAVIRIPFPTLAAAVAAIRIPFLTLAAAVLPSARIYEAYGPYRENHPGTDF